MNTASVYRKNLSAFFYTEIHLKKEDSTKKIYITFILIENNQNSYLMVY